MSGPALSCCMDMKIPTTSPETAGHCPNDLIIWVCMAKGHTLGMKSPSCIKVQPPNHKLPCRQVMSAVEIVFGWLKAPNKYTDHLLLLVV